MCTFGMTLMQEMKITAIIVTYNNAVALDIILKSIRMQRTMPGEVIIADDGSGMETTRIIGKHLPGFPCILKHVRQEHHDFRAARIRNIAIRESSCDYLLFSDGDLFWHPMFIQDFREKILPRTAWIGSRVFLTEKASCEIGRSKNIPENIRFFSPMIERNRLNAVRIPFISRICPAVSFNDTLRGGLLGVWKKDIEAVNGWNETFTGWGLEDTELVARLYHSGIQLRKMKLAGVSYHLWHEISDRAALTGNRQLLGQTLERKLVWCDNGLMKRANP